MIGRHVPATLYTQVSDSALATLLSPTPPSPKLASDGCNEGCVLLEGMLERLHCSQECAESNVFIALVQLGGDALQLIKGARNYMWEEEGERISDRS